MLCSEYGWTVEQVFSHTKAQIELLTVAMAERRKEDFKLQAGLHGANIKKESFNKSVSVTDTDKIKSMGINVIEE